MAIVWREGSSGRSNPGLASPMDFTSVLGSSPMEEMAPSSTWMSLMIDVPKRMRSPSSRVLFATRSPFTKEPFVDPRSSSIASPFRTTMRAC